MLRLFLNPPDRFETDLLSLILFLMILSDLSISFLKLTFSTFFPDEGSRIDSYMNLTFLSFILDLEIVISPSYFSSKMISLSLLEILE